MVRWMPPATADASLLAWICGWGILNCRTLYNNTRNLPRDFFFFFFPSSFLPVTIITHTITKTLYRHSRRVARAREHSRDTAAHGMRESALAYAAL